MCICGNAAIDGFLTVGRVNRDDYDDMLIINASGSLIVYYGAPGGLFSTTANLSTAFAPYRDLALGKLNNIGYDSLYAINSSTGVWYQFTGLAAGGFNMTPVQTGSGWGCCKLNTFGKFNHDDYLDLATVEVATGKLRIYPGTANNTLGIGAVDENAGAAWLNRDVAAIHSEVTGRDSLLAKDLPTGALNLYPSDPNGGVDWSDPISYGTRY